MQQDKIRISNPEAAKTLRDSPVLHLFLEPASPSEVAKKLEMPANLVHHHVKRALELGLVFIAKKEGRKIFYQLAAKNFTHKRGLLTQEQELGADLAQLSEALLQAHLRCEADAADADDPDYHTVGFAETLDLSKPSEHNNSREPPREHPAHFQAMTLRLGVAQYQQLIQTLAKLLEETKPEKNAETCTIALLGFTGEWRKGHDNTMSISSFALEV